MVLDINLFRKDKGGKPEVVKESEKRRFRDTNLVEKVIELDTQWRKKNYEAEQMAAEFGVLNKAIAKKKKASKGKDKCEEEIKQIGLIKEKKLALEEEAKALKIEKEKNLFNVGNLVHESVPISNDEVDNKIERTWGEIKEMKINSTPGRAHHHEILAMIDGYDPKRGQKISGHRGFFLKGMGAILNMALVNYGMHFLMKQGYTILPVSYTHLTLPTTPYV